MYVCKNINTFISDPHLLIVMVIRKMLVIAWCALHIVSISYGATYSFIIDPT